MNDDAPARKIEEKPTVLRDNEPIVFVVDGAGNLTHARNVLEVPTRRGEAYLSCQKRLGSFGEPPPEASPE